MSGTAKGLAVPDCVPMKLKIQLSHHPSRRAFGAYLRRVKTKCAWYKSRGYSFTVNSISDGAVCVTEPLVPCTLIL